jgi:sugar phosphate isomerase/epimerase
MHDIGRRSFLGLAAATAAPSFARTLGAIGVQLYTVRTILPQDPLKVLRAIEQIGYREVELTMDNLDKVGSALKQTSLKPIGLHLDANLFAHGQDKIQAALDSAKRRDVEYVVCPYVNPADRGGKDVVKKLGDTLNRAGEMAQKMGMRLCYHNHAFDFGPSGSGTLLDVLLQSTDPKFVNLELDIMWAKVAGVEPVSVLKKYGSRIWLLHLKNVAPGTEQRFNETVPKTTFREVGNGAIDIPPVLAAAAQTNVKHYFVEQDQTPGDPLDSLRQSYEYLAKLNY